MDKYKKVEVEWFDAQSWSGQAIQVDEFIKDMKPIHTMSAGYLVYDSKEYIILAFMLFDDDGIKHAQIIPRGMIKNIKRLK